MRDLVYKDYVLSVDKSMIDLAAVHSYLSYESYWAKGIPIEIVKRSIDNSLCFGIYKDKEQAGFARVISDFATFAYICDLFIIPSHREKGLSKFLMKSILSHPQLQGLRRLLLATWDAHGLYAQVGFVPIAKPEIWMEINDKEVYLKGEENNKLN